MWDTYLNNILKVMEFSKGKCQKEEKVLKVVKIGDGVIKMAKGKI